MKKRIALILSIVMICVLFSSTIGIYADSKPLGTFEISEYEMIVGARIKPQEVLIKEGYNVTNIKTLRSEKIEDLILERASLSEEVLKNTYYYTDDQIEILKAYDGSKVEGNPQLAAVLGSCSGQVTCIAASVSSITSRVTWNWTTAPVLNGAGIKDTIAAAWEGTNLSGGELNLALNNGGSFCQLNTVNNGNTIVHKYSSVSTDDSYGNAYKKFSMEPNAGSGYWAKSGIFQVKVDSLGTNNLKEMRINYSYGHSTVTGTPTVSFSDGADIIFGVGVQRMFGYERRITTSGQVIEYV